MNLCNKSPQKLQSDNINKMLKEDFKKESQIVKLLLLGNKNFFN